VGIYRYLALNLVIYATPRNAFSLCLYRICSPPNRLFLPESAARASNLLMFAFYVSCKKLPATLCVISWFFLSSMARNQTSSPSTTVIGSTQTLALPEPDLQDWISTEQPMILLLGDRFLGTPSGCHTTSASPPHKTSRSSYEPTRHPRRLSCAPHCVMPADRLVPETERILADCPQCDLFSSRRLI
jgi:hypothetical protein